MTLILLALLLVNLLPHDGGGPARVPLGEFVVTSYCLRGTMRDGSYTRPGSVAVDTDVLPLGSVLVIDGLPGEWTARDTGSGVRGRWVDVWAESCAEALEIGVSRRSVWLVAE